MIKLQFLGILMLTMICSFGTYAQQPDTLATFDFEKTRKEVNSKDDNENLSPQTTDSIFKPEDHIVGLKTLIFNSISDAIYVVRQDYLPNDSLDNKQIQATYSLGVAIEDKIIVLNSQLELSSPGMERSNEGLAFKNINNFRFLSNNDLLISILDSNYSSIATQSDLSCLASSVPNNSKNISGMVMAFYYNDKNNVDQSKTGFDLYEIGLACSETDCILEEKPNFPKNKFIIGAIYMELGPFDFSKQGIDTECCKRKCKQTCEKLTQKSGFLQFKFRGFLDLAGPSKKKIIQL